MSTLVPTWADLQASWSAGWKALQDQALRAYQAAISANPASFKDKVSTFVAALTESRASLDRMQGHLQSPAATEADRQRHQDLERRYHDIAAGFYADVSPTPGTAAAPVLMIGALAIGVAGVAWAVAAYEYALNLREQTALAEQELLARVQASREGRSLPPSTLPPMVTPDAPGRGGLGVLVVGGLVVTAGAFLLPALLKR